LRAVDIIRTKRDGHALTRDAIEIFVQGLDDGSWADYQVSALLMAIVLRGMTPEETAWLTEAMVHSGRRVDLSGIPGPKVGKHSTGGVGDKVSIVLAPVAAACGVVVPKMSGRGLGHTGGTLDKLEAIPGFRVGLSLDEFVAILRAVGCCIISQTRDIAPADKRLYALRDVTATIESIPLISASVMSKKIAEGSEAVVLDVKCGSGAFMKQPGDAFALARALVQIGEAHGVRTEALVTNMDAPLGRAVGNALEVAECVEVLRGGGAGDLRELVSRLAVRMLRVAQRAASDEEADAMVQHALGSGAALARFREMVARQGGVPEMIDHPERLPRARHRHIVRAAGGGYITRVDAEAIGRASVWLGAGRARVDDPIDHAAGLVLRATVGSQVAAGEPLAELHASDEQRFGDAAPLVERAITIASTPPAIRPMVLGWVHAGGEASYL
jgi:pyrimidine-nucleoside phosphorylase